MNANELADDLEYACTIAEPRIEIMKRMKLCATMLRQQQAEIEALKLQLHTTLTNRDLRTYDGKLNMNNEPVAHRYKFEEGAWKYGDGYDATGAPNDPDYLHYEPLYTHPAKTLTDEEIEDALYVADITLDNLSDGDISMERIKAFVRTVLRKAQEK